MTVLLLKYGALLSLTGARTASLILFPALGRWGMVYAVCRYPYHHRKGEGTGTVFELHKGLGSLLGATAIAMTAALFLGRLLGIVAFGITWLVTILVARYTLKKLPGLTGDVYGAINELSEAFALCALASSI
jgi:adenosylcobinamide-GDP ribazoletransferase